MILGKGSGMDDSKASNTDGRWTVELDRIVAGLHKRLVEIRRHLHQHPEPSGEETETTRYLAEVITAAGLEPRVGPEGRGAIIDGPTDASGRRVALRGDIDGLFIQDAKECDYRSQVPGLMHACGHDAHSACLVGSVLVLDELRRNETLPWPVPWRAILQPAEETATGAREMIAIGALDEVDAIYALHLDPSRPVGEIGLRDGAFTASCDEFEIRVVGRGGHGARPHETLDPIAAAAQVINGIYQMFPRRMNPLEPVVATVGEVSAGHSPNVIPETAEMKGTLRALSEKTQELAKETIADIVSGLAKTTGCRIELSFPLGCPGVMNDGALNGFLRSAAATFPEGLKVVEMQHPSMGGEDFAEYTQHVPGSMFRLGCQSSTGGAMLHSPHFDLDERSLGLGVRRLTRAVILHARPD